MSGASILEVAIGLIFIFALLAILVTQINTLISNILQWRAKQLKQAITQMVVDDRLRAELLSHPLVNMVSDPTITRFSLQIDKTFDSQAAYDMTHNIVDSEPADVGYIPPGTFVEALITILLARSDPELYDPLRIAIEQTPPSETRSLLRQQYAALQHTFSEEALADIEKTINAIPDNAVLMEAFRKMEDTLKAVRYRSPEIVPLLSGIKKIDNPIFRQAIELLVVSAGNLDEARHRMEEWFDDTMNRASSAYRGKMQLVSFVVALVVVFLLNIDTLAITRTLWENPELRASVAQAARDFDQTGFTEDTTTNPSDDTSEDTGTEGEEAPVDEVTLEELEENVEDIGETLQTLFELQIPLLWEHTTVTEDMIDASTALALSDPRQNPSNLWNLWPGNNPDWFSLLVQKILGLLVTAIAAAQGAPFWFDLLNRLTGQQSNQSSALKV